MKSLYYFMLCATMMLAGCEEGIDNGNDNGDANTEIVLSKDTKTEVTVKADEQGDGQAIKFTAAAAWTATVKETTSETDSKASEGRIEWLTLSAYEGGPGEYTLTLKIETNLTGKNRKATIEIRSGNDFVTITIEQEATTEDGKTPLPVGKKLVKYEYKNVSSKEPDYYSKKIGKYTYNDKGKISTFTEIRYFGDEENYREEVIYKFTYNDNQMLIDKEIIEGLEYNESYIATLTPEGYISQIYEKEDSHLLWMFSYSDGYLQSITYNDHFYPEDGGENDEDNNVAGYSKSYDDNIVAKFFWENGNLKLSKYYQTINEEKMAEYTYTEFTNTTPYFDFNTYATPAFGYFTGEYIEIVNTLLSLKLIGKCSNNLIVKDDIDWSYRNPGENEPRIYHEDTWSPFIYKFNEENYLDNVKSKCTLYSYQLDSNNNKIEESTSYYNDEYNFTYE